MQKDCFVLSCKLRTARQTVFLGAFCREIWMPRTGNRGTSPAHQVQTQLLYLITTTKEGQSAQSCTVHRARIMEYSYFHILTFCLKWLLN